MVTLTHLLGFHSEVFSSKNLFCNAPQLSEQLCLLCSQCTLQTPFWHKTMVSATCPHVCTGTLRIIRFLSEEAIQFYKAKAMCLQVTGMQTHSVNKETTRMSEQSGLAFPPGYTALQECTARSVCWITIRLSQTLTLFLTTIPPFTD